MILRYCDNLQFMASVTTLSGAQQLLCCWLCPDILEYDVGDRLTDCDLQIVCQPPIDLFTFKGLGHWCGVLLVYEQQALSCKAVNVQGGNRWGQYDTNNLNVLQCARRLLTCQVAECVWPATCHVCMHLVAECGRMHATAYTLALLCYLAHIRLHIY